MFQYFGVVNEIRMELSVVSKVISEHERKVSVKLGTVLFPLISAPHTTALKPSILSCLKLDDYSRATSIPETFFMRTYGAGMGQHIGKITCLDIERAIDFKLFK